MASIGGIDPTGGPQPVQPNPSPKTPEASAAPEQTDTVEISLQAQMASKAADIPPIRADLVARVKAEIEAGTYETPEKLAAAVTRLLEEL